MIADLHCDLLLYLEQSNQRTPYDAVCRCSISQMQVGGVKWQALPIFTETGTGSSLKGDIQNKIFHELPCKYPEIYSIDHDLKKIHIVRAIENASSFSEENEPLELGLKRLQNMLDEGHLAYISLTWNTENRFGGGAHTDKGLTQDGKELLFFMSGKQVAVDLSHACDRLAYDILNIIDNHQLTIRVIASHSNSRAVQPASRNLPDELTKEIIARQGLIGLNFIKPFLGIDPDYFAKQVHHLLQLGANHALCFGADFFFEEDIPMHQRRAPGEYFFDDFGCSSTYPLALALLKTQLGLSDKILEAISYKNITHFFRFFQFISFWLMQFACA